MSSARRTFSAESKGQGETLLSLKRIFAYVTDNFSVIDDALVPPLSDIEAIHNNINQKGVQGLRADDGATILRLVTGLQALSAESAPGYYGRQDFENVTAFARKIAGGMTP